jgi:hypothetical protein
VHRVTEFHWAVVNRGVVDSIEYSSRDRFQELTFSMEVLGLSRLARGLVANQPPTDDVEASDIFEKYASEFYEAIAPDDSSLIELMRPAIESKHGQSGLRKSKS